MRVPIRIGPNIYSPYPVTKATSTKKLILDDTVDENDEVSHYQTAMPSLTVSQNKSEEERTDNGSQLEEEDYDVDEEFDNDYAENYFDNGEGDDMDDLGDGGGGEMGNELLTFFAIHDH